MPTMEEIRASMKAAVLTGQGTYLPVGTHDLEILKFFYKKPGPNSALGLFIAEMKLERSTNPAAQVGGTYSETFDPTKTGWFERMKKFILASVGVDYRAGVPDEAHDLVADVCFSCGFTAMGPIMISDEQRAELVKKYNQPPENMFAGSKIRGEGSPYTTKAKGNNPGKEIVSMKWSPATPAAS